MHAIKRDVRAEYGCSLVISLMRGLLESEASFLLHVGSPSRQDYGNLHSSSPLPFRVRLAVVGLILSERLQVFHSHGWHTLLPWALHKRESKSQIPLCPSVHLLSFQLVYA